MLSFFRKPPPKTTYLDLIEQRFDAPQSLSREEVTEAVGDIHLNLLRRKICRCDQEDEQFLRLMVKIRAAIRHGNHWRQSAPLNFVVSYPRSGNTLLTRSLVDISGVQVFSSNPGTVDYIPVECFPSRYPLDRIVKTHTVPEYDDKSKYVFLMRDGRDILPSIAFMTLQRGFHNYKRKRDVADFIDWTTQHYRFGTWASFAREVLALKEKNNVMIVRYDDLIQHVDVLKSIVSFFDLPYRPGIIEKVFAEKDQVLADIKGHASHNKLWGLGSTFHNESMFHAWAQNRSKSNWQMTMDCAARRKFHETGATEFLTEFGFEQNPSWWK